MMATKIEWTDATWNPLAGCTPISPGCTHCYAATMARRLEAMGQPKYIGTAERRGSVDVFTGRINLDESALADPLGWKKPRMVFVNSMSDLFHKDVPDQFIVSVFATMYETQWHKFQVLTKRPERLSILSNPRFPWAVGVAAWNALSVKSPEKAAVVAREDVIQDVMDNWPLPNVWLGTSCEDQQRADERIPHLLKCPAAVRFISAEPLLGPIDLDEYLGPQCLLCLKSEWCPDGRCDRGLEWVIAGGESGHGARPCRPEWIHNIVKQCKAASVPCFVKQMGANVVTRNDAIEDVFNNGTAGWPDPQVECDIHGFRENYQGADCRIRLRDKKGGDPAEWPEDLRAQEFPEVSHA